jgi:hypothetical protein
LSLLELKPRFLGHQTRNLAAIPTALSNLEYVPMLDTLSVFRVRQYF